MILHNIIYQEKGRILTLKSGRLDTQEDRILGLMSGNVPDQAEDPEPVPNRPSEKTEQVGLFGFCRFTIILDFFMEVIWAFFSVYLEHGIRDRSFLFNLLRNSKRCGEMLHLA